MSDSFATPWTVAYPAPLSMGFPRQEGQNGLPFPSLKDLPDPGREPMSPALAVGFFTSEPSGKPKILLNLLQSKEKEMATHSSVLAWTIPGTEEPGGLPSMGSHRVGHDRSDSDSSSIAKYILKFSLKI